MNFESQNTSRSSDKRRDAGLYEMPENAEDFKPETDIEREQKQEKALEYLISGISKGELITRFDVEESTGISSQDLSSLIAIKRDEIRLAFYKKLTDAFIAIKDKEKVEEISLINERLADHYGENFPLLSLREGFDDYLKTKVFIDIAKVALLDDIHTTFPNLRPLFSDLPDEALVRLFNDEEISQAIHKWLGGVSANDNNLSDLYFNNKIGQVLFKSLKFNQEEQSKIDEMINLEYENILERFSTSLYLDSSDRDKLFYKINSNHPKQTPRALKLRKKIVQDIIKYEMFDMRTLDLADMVFGSDKSDIRDTILDFIKKHQDDYNSEKIFKIPNSNLSELGMDKDDWSRILISSLDHKLDMLLNNYNEGSMVIKTLEFMRGNKDTGYVNGLSLPNRLVNDIISNNKSFEKIFYDYGAKFIEKFNIDKDDIWIDNYSNGVQKLGVNFKAFILKDFYTRKLSPKEAIKEYARDNLLLDRYEDLFSYLGEKQIQDILEDSILIESLREGFLKAISNKDSGYSIEYLKNYINKFNINIRDPIFYSRILEATRSLIINTIESYQYTNTLVKLFIRGTDQSILDILSIKETDIIDLRGLAIEKFIFSSTLFDVEHKNIKDNGYILDLVTQGIYFLARNGNSLGKFRTLQNLALVSNTDFSEMLKSSDQLRALNRGLASLIRNGNDIKSIQDFIVDFGLEIEPMYLKLFEEMPDISINEQRQRYGLLTSLIIQNGDIVTLCDRIDNDIEKKRIELSLKNIKQFSTEYPISNKGITIAVLTAMNSYNEDSSLADILDKTAERLKEYKEIIEKYHFANIPKGFRASIGMEYEITFSTARAYEAISGGDPESINSNESLLKEEMTNISDFAYVGNGRDAEFEIATKPTDNPTLMLLEMELLQDLGYIDFNFSKSDYYAKGSRGYHLTIGGESNISIGPHINVLQNSLIIAGWGGINAGKSIDKNAGFRGRSSAIRQRGGIYDLSNNLVRLFNNVSMAVELRGLSIDSWEPFERSVMTSYFGSIALQIVEKYNIDFTSYFNDIGYDFPDKSDDFFEAIMGYPFISPDSNEIATKDILFAWGKLYHGVLSDIDNHNNNFIEQETDGYFDDSGIWVDSDTNNKKRFMEVAGSEEALEEYIDNTKIFPNEITAEASVDLLNACSAITNLFIKPSEKSGGDVVNAVAILDNTKDIKKDKEEHSQGNARKKSIFDNKGNTREGYYSIQGGSSKMLIHSIQKRLLEFNKEVQKIIT